MIELLMRNSVFIIALIAGLTWSVSVRPADGRPAPGVSRCREPAARQAPQGPKHILNCMSPSGHHVYYEEMSCPLGGEKFQTLVLGTHSTYGLHLDWEPVSYLDFPTPIPVCPSNGFVMEKEKYSSEELKRMAKVVDSEEYKKIYAQRHPSYYLLARFRELLGDDNPKRWWQLVVATWEADLCKSEKYAFYANEAIEAAKARLPALEPADEEYWIVNLIIPNLYRRTGRFDPARQWLDEFGGQLPEEKNGREFYALAFRLLRDAVSRKDTSQIKIEQAEKPDQPAPEGG